MYNVLERVYSVLCVSCLFVTLLRVHLALSAVLFPLTVTLIAGLLPLRSILLEKCQRWYVCCMWSAVHKHDMIHKEMSRNM